ncbi:MAG: hypothetical protein AB2693_18670, partial [Candidatus Thiodiazotropha sp.]
RRGNIEQQEPETARQRSYEQETEEDLDYLLSLNASGYSSRQLPQNASELRERRNTERKVSFSTEGDALTTQVAEAARDRIQPISQSMEGMVLEPPIVHSTPNQLNQTIDQEIEILDRKLALLKEERERSKRQQLSGARRKEKIQLEDRSGTDQRSWMDEVTQGKKRIEFSESQKELVEEKEKKEDRFPSGPSKLDMPPREVNIEYLPSRPSQGYDLRLEDTYKGEKREIHKTTDPLGSIKALGTVEPLRSQYPPFTTFYGLNPYKAEQAPQKIEEKGISSENAKSKISEEIADRRKKYEASVLAMEEEVRKREKELTERQSWILTQEEKRKQEEAIDPIVEGLKRKEKELEEKLKQLKEREKEIEKKETALKQLGYTKVVQTVISERKIEESTNESGRKTEEPKETAAAQVKDDSVKEIETKSDSADSQEKSTESQEKTEKEHEIINKDPRFIFPKFTIFSGEDPKSKTEATYEEWKYEVTCVQKDAMYTKEAIGQAVRKSLRGQAKRVLLPLGTEASNEVILNRLEAVFGNVATGESVLQEFYTAAQKQDETVTAWGLRLEEILQKAVMKGHVRKEETDGMLRNKFWKYLRSERLKNATRTKFETLKNFEDLRKAVRAEEHEMKVSSGVQHQPIRSEEQKTEANKDDDKLSMLLAKLNSLEQQMKEIQRQPRWQNRRRWQNNPPAPQPNQNVNPKEKKQTENQPPAQKSEN